MCLFINAGLRIITFLTLVVYQHCIQIVLVHNKEQLVSVSHMTPESYILSITTVSNVHYQYFIQNKAQLCILVIVHKFLGVYKTNKPTMQLGIIK